MKFAVFIIPGDRARYEEGKQPSEEVHSALRKFNEELAAADVLIRADGFHPTSKGARVVFDDSNVSVEEGPFDKSKEVISGYWIWSVSSRDEAIEWARKCQLGSDLTLELHQIFEVEDFSEEVGHEDAAVGDREAKSIGASH